MRKWKEDEEIGRGMRKWTENEEMERDFLSIKQFPLFALKLLYYYIEICNFLSQKSVYTQYALWLEGTVRGTCIILMRHASIHRMNHKQLGDFKRRRTNLALLMKNNKETSKEEEQTWLC